MHETDINLALAAQEKDVLIWVTDNKIKLQAGIFQIKNRKYQHEIINNTRRRMCVMKATQLGFTEIEVLRTLHGLIFGRYPRGVGYYFPTNDDVQEFGKTRFNPLIQSNRYAIGRFVKSQGKKGTDTSSLKKVNKSFLYLRGARMPRKIDEQLVTTKTSSIPLDRIIFDELDLMADSDSEFTIIGKARGRLGDSDLKEECYISNPTTPGFGIDTFWELSDKRHWFRWCSHCNKYTTCSELYFMEDPEKCVRIRKDGTGYCACQKCGNEILPTEGHWEPTEEKYSDYMWGYQLSQLSSVKNDPAEILKEYRDPPEDNLSEIVRLRLGWPHISSSEKLSKEDVLACCDDVMAPKINHPGPCAMGLDCMKTKNVIIGARLSNGNRIIYYTGIIAGQGMESWNEISDLCHRFHVKSAVIDIRPYEDMARHFQQKHASNMKVWLCEYKEATPLGTIFNPNTGIVQVARTEIMDSTHRLISTKGSLILPRRSNKIIEFAKQVASSFKVLETNKKTGQKIYRYRHQTNVPDHFRHSLNYFYLASGNKRIGSFERHNNKNKNVNTSTVNNNYARV